MLGRLFRSGDHPSGGFARSLQFPDSAFRSSLPAATGPTVFTSSVANSPPSLPVRVAPPGHLQTWPRDFELPGRLVLWGREVEGSGQDGVANSSAPGVTWNQCPPREGPTPFWQDTQPLSVFCTLRSRLSSAGRPAAAGRRAPARSQQKEIPCGSRTRGRGSPASSVRPAVQWGAAAARDRPLEHRTCLRPTTGLSEAWTEISR